MLIEAVNFVHQRRPVIDDFLNIFKNIVIFEDNSKNHTLHIIRNDLRLQVTENTWTHYFKLLQRFLMQVTCSDFVLNWDSRCE